MYSCIIFDVDGTLIDTEKAVILSYQRVIKEEFGRYFSEDELAIGYGIPTNESLAKYGFKNIEEADQKYHRYLEEAFNDVKPFDGIIQILTLLKERNIKTGIVTSRTKNEIQIDKSFQRLIKYFHYVVSADDTKNHKPNAEPILKLLEIADADKDGTIYIGDTYYDCMCAQNAGVKFALALWGAKSYENIKADYYLKNPDAIREII